MYVCTCTLNNNSHIVKMHVSFQQSNTSMYSITVYINWGEPERAHTSKSNSGFFIYIYIYLSTVGIPQMQVELF